MRVAQSGEQHVIRQLLRVLPAPSARVVIGPGDDGAVVRLGRGAGWVITTDQLIENIHFRWAWSRADQLGYRAGAITLSDIGAMGGVPRYLLISLGVPPSTELQRLRGFYRGLRRMLTDSAVELIGGDTASAPVFHAAMTALGEIDPSLAVSRAGARPRDLIMVTGHLGDAAAGLSILDRAHSRRSDRRRSVGTAVGRFRGAGRLVRRQLYPTPRLKAGHLLARHRLATSMLDLSDGLVMDLERLCRASRVSATIDSAQLPLSPALVDYCRRAHLDPLRMALAGGDDYELLFTVRPASAARTIRLLRRIGLPCRCIGQIDRASPTGRVTIRRQGKDFSAKQFGPLKKGTGYDHFHALRAP